MFYKLKHKFIMNENLTLYRISINDKFEDIYDKSNLQFKDRKILIKNFHEFEENPIKIHKIKQYLPIFCNEVLMKNNDLMHYFIKKFLIFHI